MRLPVFLLSAALTACASLHVEGTEGSDTQTLAKLTSTDRSSRLVGVDGTKVKGPVIGSYYVKPGERELEFQLQTPNTAGPGKSFGHGVTALDRFVTTKVSLEAGGEYFLNVDKRGDEPTIVIRKKGSRDTAALADGD